MPIYEFRCQRCRRRSSVFTRSIGGEVEAVCSHCGSREMSRLISRVAGLRAGADIFRGRKKGGWGEGKENDPKSRARWVRRMSRQRGEPLDAEMESDLERMESGGAPDDFGNGGGDDEGVGGE